MVTIKPKTWIYSVLVATIVIFNYKIGCLSQNSESICTIHKTCAECIQSKDRCAWCQKTNFASGTQARTKCNSESYYADLPEPEKCDGDLLINPDNEIYMIADKKISSGSTSNPFNVVQIRPQRVSLKLRVGQIEELKIQFAQAKDFPVDLYYLMDLSYSMKDDKDNLNKFGEQLAGKMTTVTSKFKIGFGSFVDKVVMPFVSTIDKKLQNPCGDDKKCVPPYSFQNHLKLTSEFSRFTREVDNSKVSGNMDAPEGGFDGLIQVAVCDQQIGWRKEARKFIVFATDASFHYAGDGKLGGIVKPNDLKCHLDSTGAYTHAELLDYPSISQINSIVTEKVIHIIFAVTQDQLPIYTRLKDRIEGSAVGHLSNDSSNVVELVTAEYEKITSTIEMKSTSSEEISIIYYTNCGQSGNISSKNRCTDVPIGTTIDFTAKIEVLKCPSNLVDRKKQFEIYSVGVLERIIIDLEIICGCQECEKQEISKSEKCNGVGTLSCGICKCDESHSGEHCQCNDVNGERGGQEWRCRKENSTNFCSNRGECYCGQCECNRRDDPKEEITGPFCECDNFSCERGSGFLCSGVEHGSCVCGSCQCEKGWSGAACECTTDESTCYKPGDPQKCSGKGECKCGKCECQSTMDETYSGRFCENCRNCPDECHEIAECVQCKVHKTGKIANCPSVCLDYDKIEELEYIRDNGTSNEKFCLATDTTDGCRFYFIYGYNPLREMYVKAQQTKECAPDAPTGWIIGGGAGGIVLIGLLSLILWKIFTTIQDRNEYARFEKDKDLAKFTCEMNPLFKGATSTFQNPCYEEKVEYLENWES